MEAADKKFNKKGRRQAIYLEFLVPPARFERATCGLMKRCMSLETSLGSISGQSESRHGGRGTLKNGGF